MSVPAIQATPQGIRNFYVQATDNFLDQLREGSKAYSCKVQAGDIVFFAKIECGPEEFNPFEDDLSATTANEQVTVRFDRPEGYDEKDWFDAKSAFRWAVEERLARDFSGTAPMYSGCCTATASEGTLAFDDKLAVGRCSACGEFCDFRPEVPNTIENDDFSITATWLTGETLTGVESQIERLRR